MLFRTPGCIHVDGARLKFWGARVSLGEEMTGEESVRETNVAKRNNVWKYSMMEAYERLTLVNFLKGICLLDTKTAVLPLFYRHVFRFILDLDGRSLEFISRSAHSTSVS